jgi:hypothetical protein
VSASAQLPDLHAADFPRSNCRHRGRACMHHLCESRALQMFVACLPAYCDIVVQTCRQARKLQDMVDRLQGAGSHHRLSSAAGGRPLQPSNRHLGSGGFQGGDGGHHVVSLHDITKRHLIVFPEGLEDTMHKGRGICLRQDCG